jgi:hypothetical protein
VLKYSCCATDTKIDVRLLLCKKRCLVQWFVFTPFCVVEDHAFSLYMLFVFVYVYLCRWLSYRLTVNTTGYTLMKQALLSYRGIWFYFRYLIFIHIFKTWMKQLKDVSYYNKIYDYLSTLKLIARGHGGRDRTHCWIYNYLCKKCISPLTLWARTPLRRGVLDTTLCDKVCQWLAQVDGFLRVLQFPPPIKLTSMI